MLQIFGGLSEWSKVAVLKAVVLKGTGSSNLPPSALNTGVTYYLISPIVQELERYPFKVEMRVQVPLGLPF